MVNIKNKILDAALKEFLSQGKSGAKTKAIADSAGVNKAMIHYYFSSKELLFLECVKYILVQVEGTFHTTEVRSITDYKSYITALIESYSSFIQNHDKQITFLLWEYLNDKELLTQIKNIIGSAHLIDFIQKTKRATKNGIIRDLDPLDLYLNLVSLILSTYMILPITLSFLGEDSEDKKVEIMTKRKAEIARLLWNDIKGE
ncbi:MAG: TetR/AcrR family transcriptional regulator [Spirochaetaceae bacterium]